MRFRKKAVIIEAEQWFPGKRIGCVREHRANRIDREKLLPERYGVHNDTDYGLDWVVPGDWIITDAEGYTHLCRADDFAKTYELVEEANRNG